MGNKVSAVRYPWSIQVANIKIAGIFCPELLEGIIHSIISTLTTQELLKTMSSGLSAPNSQKPIDFGKSSLIWVKTHSGSGYWDVSFEDPRALKKFTRELSRELLRTAGGQTPEEEKETNQIMKQFGALVAIEEQQKMPQVPRTIPICH